jgi:foldase protein PrsA
MVKKKTSASKAVPVKKSAPKSSVKSTKKTSSKSAVVAKSSIEKNTSTQNSSLKPVQVRKSSVALVVLAILGLAFILAWIFNFRGLKGVFVAATVNGQPISRLAVVRETEKQAGKQTLQNLVRNSLIEQEARKQKVTVTDKEIDDEIKKVEESLTKQGQKMDQVLELQGLSRNDLRKLIRLDKLVSKMVGKDIKVSDKDIDAYIEKNRESLPQDQTEEQLRKSVVDSLRQQQLNEKVQKWLSDIQSKAKIQEFVQY